MVIIDIMPITAHKHLHEWCPDVSQTSNSCGSFSFLFSCTHTKPTQTCRPATDLTENVSCIVTVIISCSCLQQTVLKKSSDHGWSGATFKHLFWKYEFESVCCSFIVREGEKSRGRSPSLVHSFSSCLANVFVLFHGQRERACPWGIA